MLVAGIEVLYLITPVGGVVAAVRQWYTDWASVVRSLNALIAAELLSCPAWRRVSGV